MVSFTSSQSVISDTFKEIYLSLKEDENIFFYASKFCLPNEVNKNTQKIFYEKNLISFLKIIKFIYKLRKYVIKNKVESIFIFSTLPVNSLISLIMPKYVKVNHYLHDPITHSGEKKAFIALKKYDDLILSIKSSNVFISSNYIKRDFLKTSFKRKKCTILPLPLVDSLVNYRELSEEKTGIIFFGRIEKYKGLEWFFNALIKYGNKIKEKKIPIYVLGKGILPENIYVALNMGFNITIKNEFVSNKDLAYFINKSKVSVFPYRDATGTSAIQTSGAMGVWPILSEVGGLRESSIENYSSVIQKDDAKLFVREIENILERDISNSSIATAYQAKYNIESFSTNLIKLID